LFERDILSESTFLPFFNGLLGLDERHIRYHAFVNESRIEAALLLITKVGPKIDEKLKSPQVEDREQKQNQVAKIYERFEFFMNAKTTINGNFLVPENLKIRIK
jgi:hypothetical protein